ncbi:MAG UNVERIFIED_CONTAM: hypothetical protein LVR18_45865 [Planctomycetaceae bacterium]|jgi:hypothetical protein
MSAHAERIALIGMEDVITLEGQDITLQVNGGTVRSPLGFFGISPFVNFASSFESSPGAEDGVFQIPTGGEPMPINFNSELIRAVVGYAELEVAGVVQLIASAAFVKGPTTTVTLTDGSEKNVATMSVGIANARGFQGINGPYCAQQQRKWPH